jgi:hypothetical protein
VTQGAGFQENWRERLGRKVSVRYRLHGDPEHPFSEAIGVVASVTSVDGTDTITIVNRRGVTTEIRAPDLLAAKVFPLPEG